MLVRIEPLKSFIAARPWLRFYRHDNYSDVAGLQARLTDCVGDWKLEPSLAANRLPKDRRPAWQMREWASSTRECKTRSEGLSQAVFKCGLTPELTGAGGPIGPQGTNIGHENGEAMANVGVRVERFVRLGRVGRVCQVHSNCVRFECPKKRSNGLRAHTFRWTCSQCKSYEFSWRSS
jgi:hypothetical protein